LNQATLHPTNDAIASLIAENPAGPINMLNLLRFRDQADYRDSPELAGAGPCSGAEAYQRYMQHTAPFLQAFGGELQFLGNGSKALIGPADERWDLIMLVRQRSLKDFLAFATNEAYLKGLGHRTAALEDSRLFPLSECPLP